jgi:hypothetical protein
MKPKIISVSRRTDIPAFYGDWFMGRLADGYAGYVNPFGGQRYLVDLRPENVLCFVFWSKNYAPFLPHLQTLQDRGYRAYFNFTITGLPSEFESNLVPSSEAVATLKSLSDMHSPAHINWRYDPIVLSDRTPAAWHIDRFDELAEQLQGHVERCYFSFAVQYGKVQRSFSDFQRRTGVTIEDPDLAARRELAETLADIAAAYGMTLHTCCGDDLITDRIFKAHCIDGEIIRKLFAAGGSYKVVPTRKECGCCESADIGKYDTCPHGCIYCYANINKRQAEQSHARHDPASVFLGYSKAQSDEWMQDLAAPMAVETSSSIGLNTVQLPLFP